MKSARVGMGFDVHPFVDGQAAGGVNEHQIPVGFARMTHRPPSDVDRGLAISHLKHGNVRLAAQYLSLLDGCGPLHVGRREERPTSPAAKVNPQLGGRGGFAPAL